MTEGPARPKDHLKDVYRTPLDRRDRLQVLRLDKNEDPVGLPAEFLEGVLSRVSPSFVSAYPQPYQLYERIARWIGLSDDHLLVTSGSDAAIKTAFEVFVEPGDEVVFPDPTYAMYNVYGKLFQAKVKHVPYTHDLVLPMDELREAISEDTRLVCIANPDSPTGTIISCEDIKGTIEKAGEVGAVVLVDEAYYPFYNGTVMDMVTEYENLIVTRTFSKAFRLASVRLGFAVAHPTTMEAMRKFRPMYEVNAFAVLLGSAILDNMDLVDGFVSAVKEGKGYIEAEAAKRGIKTHETHGNFIHIVIGKDHVMDLVEHMRKSGIFVSGGFSHPGLVDCMRISLGPVEVMEKVMEALDGYIKGGPK